MKTVLISLIFLFGIGSTVCFAESDVRNPYMYERFTLKGGIVHHSVSGDFSYQKDGDNSKHVDLEDLGLDESVNTPVIDVRLRLGKRLSLNSGYFGYHEDAKQKSPFDYEFGDITIPVGAITDSEIDLDVYFVNLGYSVYSTANTEVGLGIGIHGADFSLDISAETDPGNLPIEPEYLGHAREDFLAPLPNLYFFASRALMDNLLLHLTGGWMSLTYDDYDGNLYFFRATLDYRIKKHFGIGGGYSYYNVDVEYEPDHKTETYDVEFSGPMAYLILGF
jgi:hypothetical protein